MVFVDGIAADAEGTSAAVIITVGTITAPGTTAAAAAEWEASPGTTAAAEREAAREITAAAAEQEAAPGTTAAAEREAAREITAAAEREAAPGTTAAAEREAAPGITAAAAVQAIVRGMAVIAGTVIAAIVREITAAVETAAVRRRETRSGRGTEKGTTTVIMTAGILP